MDSSETKTDVMVAKPPDTGELTKGLTPAERDLIELTEQAAARLDEAMALVVNDTASFRHAETLMETCATVERGITAVKRPEIDGFNRAHKESLARLRVLIAPLQQAKDILTPKMMTHQREQKRLDDIAAADLQKKLAAEAKERQTAVADQLFEAGREEEALTVLDTRLAVPVVELPATLEKPRNITFREIHFAEVFDASLVPPEWCMTIPDMERLNKHAKATQGKHPIPGVVFKTKPSTTVRRG